LKACLDAPWLKDKSPEATRQAALDVGALQVLSHYNGEYERDAHGQSCLRKGETNLPAFVAAMAETGYQGYLSYELCHPLPVLDGQTAGIEFCDRNARLAAEYMRGLIAEAK